MFWILIACTVGPSGPASPNSQSAIEAQNMSQYAEKAGALSNAARELEIASAAARNRIENGANPATETQKIEEIIGRIETLEAELSAENESLIQRIRQDQSTEETRQ